MKIKKISSKNIRKEKSCCLVMDNCSNWNTPGSNSPDRKLHRKQTQNNAIFYRIRFSFILIGLVVALLLSQVSAKRISTDFLVEIEKQEQDYSVKVSLNSL